MDEFILKKLKFCKKPQNLYKDLRFFTKPQT